MNLPSKLFNKYLERFDELITEGEAIYTAKRLSSGQYVDIPTFNKWLINYNSLLDQIIPLTSVHRKLIEKPHTFWDSESQLRDCL